MREEQIIEIDSIEVGERLRPVDEAHVDVIAASITESGLLQPIVVTFKGENGDHEAGYLLVAGAHRLAAVKKNGNTLISAIVQTFDSYNEFQLAEIDENLMRHELSPLDRAIFLAKRKEVYDALHPDTAKPGRKKKANKNNDNELAQSLRQFGETFTKDVAKRVNLAPRTVQLSLQIANSLSDEVLTLLRQTDIGRNQAQLQKLAELSEEEQLAALKNLIEGRAKTARAALMGKAEKAEGWDKNEASMLRFIAIWTKADTNLRKRIKNYIATNKDVLPVDNATDEEGEAA